MADPTSFVRALAYVTGSVAIAISWFTDFSYLEIRDVNGFVTGCTGFDLVALICGGVALICSAIARSALLAVGAASAIAIGLNFADVLCPETVPRVPYRTFP